MTDFYKLRIKKITRETEDSVSLLFDVPDKLKDTFHFHPGQYITIRFELNGEELRRAYSICSSPDSGDLCIAIKAIEGGKFSVFANSELAEGDELEVSKPEGKFVLIPDSGNQNNYLAFVAGSGITPVLSMIRSVLETEKNSRFFLVYGNKSKSKTMFKEAIDSLSKMDNSRLNVTYVFSKEEVQDALSGRIDTDKVKQLFDSQFENISFDKVFLCGPEQMVNSLEEELQNRHIEKEKILFELFAPPEEKIINEDEFTGKSSITFILDEDEDTFEMDQKDSILKAALSNHLDAPYSCQGGICSSCLARVTEGKAVMVKNTILNQEEVDEGLILTCQAHPVTSKIVVDFDDV